MSKKDISKILTTGSPKQRLLLIAEDIARGRYSIDKILTDHEFNNISNSFKTPTEIKLWNKWKRIDERIANSIMNLQGLKFEVLMDLSDLRGYILVLHTIENTEILVNSVLHEVKDIKERKKLSEKGAKGIDLLFSKTTIDPEGYLDIAIDFKPDNARSYTLLKVINNVKTKVITSATKYISWSKAIEDFMDEEGFNVKTYRDMIKAMDSQVYQNVIMWYKYLECKKTFLDNVLDNTDIVITRVDKIKIKPRYNIAPDLFKLEVDEDIYNWFSKEFLRDE